MHEIEPVFTVGDHCPRIGKRERRRRRMLGALQGRCCIYKERGFLALVRIVSIKNERDVYYFSLEVVKPLTLDAPDCFEVGVAGEYLSISPNWSLKASWVNWSLVTRTDLVSLVLQSFESGMPVVDLVKLVSRIN